MEDPADQNILRAVIPIVFMVALIVFAIISALLNYHWERYELLPRQVRKVRRIYFGGAGLLFLIMIITGAIVLL